MPTVVRNLSLVRAFEGALRDGLLLDEALGGVLSAALTYFDATSAALLPTGDAPPVTRSSASVVASVTEQRLVASLQEVLTTGKDVRRTETLLTYRGLPIKVLDQLRGAFGVVLPHEAEGKEVEEALKLFARTVGHVLERERSRSTLVKRREEAVALFELASGALHTLKADEVIQLTAASLARELGFEKVSAFRFDAESQEVTEIATHGAPPAHPPDTWLPLRHDDILVRCLAERARVFDDDPESTGSGQTRKRRLALPLVSGELVFGFLTMSRKGAFVLTPTEMRLAEELAKLAAGALEKARLLDAERRTSERVALVARLHSVLGGVTEISQLLGRTVELLGQELDLDLCAIGLPAHGEQPVATAVYERSTGEARTGPNDLIPVALQTRLTAAASNVLISGISSDPHGLALLPAGARQLARPLHLVAVPLTTRDSVVGVLAGVAGGRKGGLDTAVLHSFEAVAAELSLDVAAVRLRERERESYRFLDALRSLGRALTITFDATRIKQTLCAEAVSLLKMDCARYWDADPASKSLQVTAQAGERSGRDIGLSIPLDDVQNPVVTSFLQKELVLADEAGAARLFPPEDVPDQGPLLAAVIPLVYQEELAGILTVESWHLFDGWPPQLPGRLSLLADTAAVALHNARLMKIIERQSERDVQTGLYNRVSVLKRLESEIRRAERNGQHLSIANVRLEGLMEAVQRYGAEVGEAILPKAAAQLVRSTRAVNVVGRDSFDRFWILIFDATLEQAEKALAAIQRNFDGNLDPRLTTAGIHLVLTAGIATYPDHAFDTDNLVSRAAAALERAMTMWPGAVVCHSDEPADTPQT